MFSTNSSKICCSFAKNKIFEISKIDGGQDGGHVVKRLLPWQQFFFKSSSKAACIPKGISFICSRLENLWGVQMTPPPLLG